MNTNDSERLAAILDAAGFDAAADEASANLILFGVMFYLVRNTKRGITTASYLIVYGMLRFMDEFFRGDHIDSIAGYFTRAQAIGLFLIPAGIVLLIYFMRYDKKNNKAAR